MASMVVTELVVGESKGGVGCAFLAYRYYEKLLKAKESSIFIFLILRTFLPLNNF